MTTEERERAGKSERRDGCSQCVFMHAISVCSCRETLRSVCLVVTYSLASNCAVWKLSKNKMYHRAQDMRCAM